MREVYEELIEDLAAAGVPLSPAECHGTICGLICAGGPIAASAWIEETLATATGSTSAVHELRTALDGMRALLQDELADPLVADFEPLLPEDHRQLPMRTDALASWVESFLGGLGLGGFGDLDALTQEAQEALNDLAEIARLDGGDEDDEDSERALVEVHEYLRVVVQLLYAELSQPGEADPPEGATIH